ncbi:MAG: zinc ribbon domain-containing protein [Phycisphaerae bacterium]|nr:zinc ribbon domain-containing protein [Phycisphaerae bacterium]
MPTYEYVCESCGGELERFESITARPLRKCPKCGKNKLKRLIGTGAGIIFKGSGFYETDYRSESYKKGAESEKKSKEKATEKTADKKGKGESKGSKTESKSKSTSKEENKTA